MNNFVTDSELELHIKQCSDLMKDAYARYEVSGCLSDRGEADGFRLMLDAAIAAKESKNA